MVSGLAPRYKAGRADADQPVISLAVIFIRCVVRLHSNSPMLACGHRVFIYFFAAVW